MGSSYSSPTFPDAPEVETKYGRVIGRRLVSDAGREADAYQGIPFAQPPVGPLRFQKPLPPLPWNGVLHAQRWPNRSMQKNFPFQNYPRDQVRASEDCLYLNVFTPGWTPPEGGFSVIIFIHGGAYMMDGTSTYGDEGICQNLVSRGGCVVVTIQYRLGLLGFFTLGDESAVTNNLAFWDQRQALLWVRECITSFGGCRDNITVMGQSAGGASTEALAISPHTRDLFHKLAPLAGSAYSPWSGNTGGMRGRCENFARQQGIEWETPHELIEKLRALPEEAFCLDDYFVGRGIDSEIRCTPTWCGEFFDNRPMHELRREAPPKPCLAGVCRLEALLFTAGGRRIDKRTADRILEMAVPASIPDRDRVKADFMAKYYDPQTMSSKERYRAWLELASDVFVNVPTLRLARDWVRQNEGTDCGTFLYNFDYFNPCQFTWRRWFISVVDSTHCTELIYLLGKAILLPFNFNDNDYKMIAMTSTAFANFAAYGNPTGREDREGGEGGDRRQALSSPWLPLTKDNPERNYAFRLEPNNEEDFLGGRSGEMIAMHESYPGDGNWYDP